MSYHNPKPHPFKAGRRPISVRSLNEIREGIKSQMRGVQGIYAQDFGDRTTLGLRDPKPILPSPQNYLQQMVVLQEYDDLLLCTPLVLPQTGGIPRPLDYSVSGGLIDPLTDKPSISRVWVAKPYFLQRTPWDGEAVPYGSSTAQVVFVPPPLGFTAPRASYGQRYLTLTNGTSKLETIFPTYLTGDIITCAKTLTGYRQPSNTTFQTPATLAAALLSAETQGAAEPVLWQDANAAGRTWAPLFLGASSGAMHIPLGFTFVRNDPADVLVQWNGVKFDTGGFWNIANPERFTVQEDGYYYLHGMLNHTLTFNHWPSALQNLSTKILVCNADTTIVDALIDASIGYSDSTGIEAVLSYNIPAFTIPSGGMPIGVGADGFVQRQEVSRTMFLRAGQFVMLAGNVESGQPDDYFGSPYIVYDFSFGTGSEAALLEIQRVG